MHVLLVEDEEIIARPLASLLRAEGWTVEAVPTAAQARERIAQRAFDAALIDLGLPDGSGYEVCRAVRKAGDAAVIILTARSDEDSVVREFEPGSLTVKFAAESVPPVKPRPRPLIFAACAPRLAASGSAIKVVLSPTPPVLCLSTLTPGISERSTVSPDFAIASVSAAVSRGVMPRMQMAMSIALI